MNRLVIEVQFDHDLSAMAQSDVKRWIHEWKSDLEAVGGTVTKAELTKAEPLARPDRETR